MSGSAEQELGGSLAGTAAPAPGPSARADLVSAVVWIALGAAIAVGSWRMERLAELHVNPYTVPGLVPGMLGAGLVLMGALLLLRSARVVQRAPTAAVPSPGTAWGRVALAAALCLLYAGGLLGRGIPFWLSSGGFVLVTILAFDRPDRHAPGEPGGRLRRVIVAILTAAGSAAAITLLFQEIFLVRLP